MSSDRGQLMPQVKALTIHQPWADLIIRGEKDIENREWAPSFRGILLIHAGRNRPRYPLDYYETVYECELQGIKLDYRAIIGEVTLSGIVRNSESKWAEPGQYHWQLTNPVVYNKPIIVGGSRGLWNPTKDIMDTILF